MSHTFFEHLRGMMRRQIPAWTLLAAILTPGPQAAGQTPSANQEVTVNAADGLTFETVLQRVSARASEQHKAAAEELNRTRERIAAEKAPMLEKMRAAEARILAATSETRRLETRQENAGTERRRLLKELDAVRKATVFATTTTRDSLAAMRDGLSPGEAKSERDAMEAILARMDDTEKAPETTPALDAIALILARLEHGLGGYAADGEAVHAVTSQVVRGQFAFAGPEVFFRAADGSFAGPVRQREGSDFPVVYPLSTWAATDAARYFGGEIAAIPVDASGGKALRLQQTHGSIWTHIEKGGVMAFVILGVGVLAVVMILQKVRDVARMRPEAPAKVETFLAMVARSDYAEAARVVAGFKGTTRELFDVGLEHRTAPKAILEEHLESVLLEQRLHFERRLPLLAVIATAAPLMGLLGTVVGMVKTFALITVFGTGNAGKLSSGISEVLVATELGLSVAIPTLIAHGFLAHRIEKNLAQLERYALRFAIAVETARSRSGAGSAKAEALTP